MVRFKTLILILGFLLAGVASGESQDEDYLGVTDPFGDPTSYEFAEDEKADKEFFHLGRFIMLGVNLGGAIFTGDLGLTTGATVSAGGKLIYFFDKHIGFEAAVQYSLHTEQGTAQGFYEQFVAFIPITLGIRYYFGTNSAPKFVAMANPYLAFGGGYYLRTYSVATAGPIIGVSDNGQFGFYGGAGVEFPIYRQTFFLGIDLRYHVVFFFDDGLSGPAGTETRNGGVFIPALTLTYNF